jgi:hypothetical protein
MFPLSLSFRRVLLAFAAPLMLASLAVRPALAADYDYTDSWYVAAESGWGVNFTQSDNFIFATFFIYGPDKKPTWYTAEMSWDGTAQFAGGLYRTEGSYFAAPWNVNDKLPATQVGTAIFRPSTTNSYEGTLTYTVTGVGTVVKPITRLTLTPILLAADYVGGQAGRYSGCNTSSENRLYRDYFTLKVSQAGLNVSMAFTYSGGLVCTIAGTMVQNGSIHRIANATYKCADGLNTNAIVSELRATPLGIEGQFVASNVGGGCREDARFAATLD